MGSKIDKEGARYRARLDSTLTDNKVTLKEADALIKNAKNGHFSQVEAHYLSGFVDRKKRSFDPEARAKLVAFVEGEMENLAKIAGDTGLSNRPKQPKLTEDSKKTGLVTWDARPGELTVKGFGVDDALQGQVGDCYFIAALASVAKTHPELLAKAVKTNRDGTYTVTFFENKKGPGPLEPVSITIDGTFANRSGRLEYAAARETKELWPMIFEKAYAAWKGGFDAIEAGMSATALEALTGTKPDFFAVTSNSNPTELWNNLKKVTSGGGCVVALSKPWDPSEQGVVADHAYTLLGVEEKNGQKFVQLRNPWGEREPGQDGRDDGIFSMPLEKFMTSFATVEFAKP
jgi:multidrug efflux pump subunit AcrA (membrane-fusion protein)